MLNVPCIDNRIFRGILDTVLNQPKSQGELFPFAFGNSDIEALRIEGVDFRNCKVGYSG